MDWRKTHVDAYGWLRNDNLRPAEVDTASPIRFSAGQDVNYAGDYGRLVWDWDDRGTALAFLNRRDLLDRHHRVDVLVTITMTLKCCPVNATLTLTSMGYDGKH